MNFFQSQAIAKRQTVRLVIMFVLAVLSLIILINLFVMFVMGYISLDGQAFGTDGMGNHFDWRVFGLITICVSLVILIGSLTKIDELSGGGSYVAKSLGGVLVKHSTKNYEEKVLLNVVEEMAIAAGTPVPEVYLLRDEKGINAFAAGFTTDDAVIGVTQGSLDYFTREELQGVIAHEFSHIIHGDMRLNMRLVGILHGILVIGLIGYYIMRASRYFEKNGRGLVFIGLVLAAIGYGGTFFGNMIKASISRKREYLADASAVQYTRNNRGIADALIKIGGYTNGSKLESEVAPTMSHAFFASGIKSSFLLLFATHPPLRQRIRSIDPHWSGKFPKVTEAMKKSLKAKQRNFTQDRFTLNLFDYANSRSKLIDSIGQLDGRNIDLAHTILTNIPFNIKENIYSIHGAKAVIYGLLLAHINDEKLMDKQLSYLKDNNTKEMIEKIQLMLNDFRELKTELRLPLVGIALPQLRNISVKESEDLLKDIDWLIKSDNHVNIFEWLLDQRIKNYFKSDFEGADFRTIKYNTLEPVKADLEVLVSLLLITYVDKKQQLTVFNEAQLENGIEKLNFIDENSFTIDNFTIAISRLSLLKPELKEKVIKLLYFIVTQDKDFSIEEQETLRILSDCLGCPVPLIN